MPCTLCRADFNLFNWKLKCGECDEKYCSKCLKKREGIFYCEKCMILLKRPPDRVKLMELKPKDLQAYLNKNNISTYGLVEKQELVDLFINKHLPEKPKKNFVGKVTANIAGTTQINQFFDSIIAPEQRPNGPKGSAAPNVPHEPTTIYRNIPRFSRQTPPPTPVEETPPEVPEEPLAPPPAAEMPETATTEPQPTTSSVNIEVNGKKDETPEGSPLPNKYPKLSDFETAEEINCLSSKQLKQLLTLNRVDFKGCVEKNELLERATRLWQDNNELHKELPENIQDLCKLCMDGPLDCVLLECGHIATCIDCGKKLAECPICRQYVIRVVRTFKA
ncbi:unnamed protein product [Brassicogethes aeneus]|uniref:RING-type domain-containing protein n=1 Tax=Brassicogethes aeneus TaxID=1431903 RepID=A0A9P0FI15_BRAAE|nr:unnamed protein product [Brassicogethes aeneus]